MNGPLRMGYNPILEQLYLLPLISMTAGVNGPQEKQQYFWGAELWTDTRSGLPASSSFVLQIKIARPVFIWTFQHRLTAQSQI